MNTKKSLLVLGALLLLAPNAAAASPGEAFQGVVDAIVAEAQTVVGSLLGLLFLFGGFRLFGAGDDPVKRTRAISFMAIGGVGALVVFFGPSFAEWLGGVFQGAA